MTISKFLMTLSAFELKLKPKEFFIKIFLSDVE